MPTDNSSPHISKNSVSTGEAIISVIGRLLIGVILWFAISIFFGLHHFYGDSAALVTIAIVILIWAVLPILQIVARKPLILQSWKWQATESVRLSKWLSEESYQWSELRAIIALPATIVTGLLVFTHSLVFLLLSISLAFFVAIPALMVCWLIIAALAVAWYDLWLKRKGNRVEKWARFSCGLILVLGLAVEYVRFSMGIGFRGSVPELPLIFKFVIGFIGGDAIAHIKQRLITLEVEWIAVIVAIWLLVELVVPAPTTQRRGPARGWCMLLLLAAPISLLAIERYQVFTFMASPASLSYRMQRPGTVAEALCRGDFVNANERFDRLGAGLNDEELLWNIHFCVPRLLVDSTPSVENKRLYAKLISSIARNIAAHGLAIESGRYCGKGAEPFLWAIYNRTFTPEYLESAKEGGLSIDCLIRQDDSAELKEEGTPIWWRAVKYAGEINAIANSNYHGLSGDTEEGKRRLLVLKQLGIHPEQKNASGLDLLSLVNGSSSNEWIEALVDEGLDTEAVSKIDRMPLRIRLTYRRFGIEKVDCDGCLETPKVGGSIGEAARLSQKVGDPSSNQLRQALGGSNLVKNAMTSTKVSDEQKTQFWAWVAEKIGPRDTIGAILSEVQGDRGPKLQALISELGAACTSDDRKKCTSANQKFRPE